MESPQLPFNNSRRWAQRFIAFLFGLFLSAVILELGIRFMKRDIAIQPDPILFRSLRPNVERRIYGYDSPEVLKTLPNAISGQKSFLGTDYTNNIGFRMKENVYEKQPGEKRILFLGDSFTEADGVDDSQRFYQLAQSQFPTSTITGERWRILNGSIQGGTPSQYIVQLREWLPRVKPDMVLVFFAPGDVVDDFDSENLYGYEFDASGIPLRFQNRASLWLLQKSYLLRYFDVFMKHTFKFDWRTVSHNLSEKRPDLSAFMCARDVASEERFMKKTGKYLLELKQMAESFGAEFGVFMIHYLWEFENEPSYNADNKEMQAKADAAHCAENKASGYRNFISNFLKENNIWYYDSFNAFFTAKQNAPQTKLWNYYDYHFSPAGHNVMADEVIKFLKEKISF